MSEKHYQVSWVIDVFATNAVDAAKQACTTMIQVDVSAPESATCFLVECRDNGTGGVVDLHDEWVKEQSHED